MDAISELPASALTASGPISEQFQQREISNVRAAAAWIHGLPYGPPPAGSRCEDIFTVGQGTCTTKHGVMHLLGDEQGLPLRRVHVLYALDESIVAGSGAILAESGIPFVPAQHCVLEFEALQMDLTAGNNNGKRKVIDTFLTTWPDPPSQDHEDNRQRMLDWVESLLASDPAFADASMETIAQTQSRCYQQMHKNRAAGATG